MDSKEVLDEDSNDRRETDESSSFTMLPEIPPHLADVTTLPPVTPTSVASSGKEKVFQEEGSSKNCNKKSS